MLSLTVLPEFEPLTLCSPPSLYLSKILKKFQTRQFNNGTNLKKMKANKEREH